MFAMKVPYNSQVHFLASFLTMTTINSYGEEQEMASFVI